MENQKLISILKTVYSKINQLKTALALNDILRAWQILNSLSDYITSIDVSDENMLEDK